jgi:hypothetical protein
VIDQENVFGLSLNRTRNPLSVLRAQDEGAQNQEIQGALE